MVIYDTIEKVAGLATIDPEFSQALENLGPLETPLPFSIEEIRKQQYDSDLAGYNATTNPQVQDQTVLIPMRDGYANEARVFKCHLYPESPHGPPLVALVYGGGFMSGSNLQFAPIARAIALECGAVVVTLSYRLAPEYKFPQPSDDIWDNVEWLSKNAETSTVIGADLSAGFILGGGSAGANLCAVAAHRAVKEQLSPPITGLWSAIPVLLAERTAPLEYRDLHISLYQNVKAPFFNTETVQFCLSTYGPNVSSEAATPFNAMDTFSRMAPTFIQVAGLDPLRDDGLVYARTLRDYGVATRVKVYSGVPHAFHVAFPSIEKSRKFYRDALEGIKWLLSLTADPDNSHQIQF